MCNCDGHYKCWHHHREAGGTWDDFVVLSEYRRRWEAAVAARTARGSSDAE